MRRTLVELAQALPEQYKQPALPRAIGTAPNALHALQCDVLEAVATGQPLDEVARILCRRVEQLTPSVVCSILSIDGAGRLHTLAAPNLPQAYVWVIDGTSIGPDAGSCGTAAFHGRPIETTDIAADPLWAQYRAIPLAAGLRACWSIPIKGRAANVLGTFSLYYRSCRAPSTLERRIVEAGVRLCALAIEHDQVRSRLEQTNHRFDLALSNMSQGLCFFDSEQNLIVANNRYSEIFDLAPASVVPGMSLREILELRAAAGSSYDVEPDVMASWEAGLLRQGEALKTVVSLKNGRTIALNIRRVPDSGWVATHEDITERTINEARIGYMAHHDALTGLPNRILFHQRMEQALDTVSRGNLCAVLCLDIDHFKAINDTFGHATGDALLLETANRLKACASDIDTVTRLGGDEFAFLAVGLDHPDSAADLAKRIAQALSEPFNLDGNSIAIGVSIGISIAPRDGHAPSKLLRSADTALYRAQTDERGTYRFFEPEMDERLQSRMTLAWDLRQALHKLEFEVVYQPVFNLAGNAICCFEALLRWHHPVRGMVSPAEFIPIAEETGQIIPIGAWVLRQACAEARNWPERVKVAVNLSAAQFKDKGLIETVTQVLAATGLAATRLELEITESMLLKNSTGTLAMLHQLRDLGASISMDDFGTGYSSLSYLRSFPFDKIKIDQSFIRDLSDKPESIAIIRAIISLGRSLAMVTTAEGVETPEQLALLRLEGCGEVQGYIFSRPTSAANAALMFCSDAAGEKPGVMAVTAA